MFATPISNPEISNSDIHPSAFHPSALAEIYQEKVSLAVWQRKLEAQVADYAQWLANITPCFHTRFIQSPKRLTEQLTRELPPNKHRQAFIQDVALIADMFSCLFELDAVGLRLTALNTAMCPKFHVDQVPCRLICTYAGTATQWHAHEHVQRHDDGRLTPLPEALPLALSTGDVALLKGEAWEGNEGRGLIHRSPEASDSDRRVILTLDFA